MSSARSGPKEPLRAGFGQGAQASLPALLSTAHFNFDFISRPQSLGRPASERTNSLISRRRPRAFYLISAAANSSPASTGGGHLRCGSSSGHFRRSKSCKSVKFGSRAAAGGLLVGHRCRFAPDLEDVVVVVVDMAPQSARHRPEYRRALGESFN